MHLYVSSFQLDELHNQQRQLNSLAGEIDQWFSRGKSSEIERAQHEVDRLATRKLTLDSSKRETEKKVSNLNLALMNCENEDRNLRNNLKLRLNRTEKDIARNDLQALNKSLDDFQVQQLIRNIQRLEEKLERCKLKVDLISS